MVCVATESDDVVNVACPEAMATFVAKVLAPSVNVTVPVGVPVAGGTAATVAVKVTVWPNTDGLTVEVTVVLLAAEPTTWGDAESSPVPVRNLVSPE